MKTNKKKESSLSIVRLKELIEYNSETGKFIWIAKSSKYTNKIKIGDSAGCWNKGHGYLGIWIDGNHYLAHRLAWFYHYGVFPEKVINHKNHDKTDNRIDNLEDVTQKTNTQSRSKQIRDDPSLPMGVVARKSKSRDDNQTVASYYAHWTDIDGRLCHSPFFNVIKCGGHDSAIAQATTYREAKITELNTAGAHYTDRHGK
jgi:hypothetical protein